MTIGYVSLHRQMIYVRMGTVHFAINSDPLIAGQLNQKYQLFKLLPVFLPWEPESTTQLLGCVNQTYNSDQMIIVKISFQIYLMLKDTSSTFWEEFRSYIAKGNSRDAWFMDGSIGTQFGLRTRMGKLVR